MIRIIFNIIILPLWGLVSFFEAISRYRSGKYYTRTEPSYYYIYFRKTHTKLLNPEGDLKTFVSRSEAEEYLFCNLHLFDNEAMIYSD